VTYFPSVALAKPAVRKGKKKGKGRRANPIFPDLRGRRREKKGRGRRGKRKEQEEKGKKEGKRFSLYYLPTTFAVPARGPPRKRKEKGEKKGRGSYSFLL